MDRPGFMTLLPPTQYNPLAPDAPAQGAVNVFATDSVSEEEERELRQVALFAELLEVSFRQKEHFKRLGYKAETWKKLYSFWDGQLRDADHWKPELKRRKRRIEDTLIEGMLMVDTQMRLYGNSPWFSGDQSELSRSEMLNWISSLDQDDVHFTLYMYFDGGWKDRISHLDKTRNRLKLRSEKSIRRPMTAPVLKEAVDRGSGIAEELINGFQKSKGYPCTNIDTLVDYWKLKCRKHKLWALYSEPDVRKTLESYYKAKEDALKTQRTENIQSVILQKSKPKQPSAKTLPKNFVRHAFADYKGNKLIFDLIILYHTEKKVYSNDPKVLIEFWNQKDDFYSSLKMSVSEDDHINIRKWKGTMSLGEGFSSVKTLIDNFFSRKQILARILHIYQYAYGFPADSAIKALALWKRLAADQRYEAGVYYEPSSQLKDFLVNHFRKDPAPPPAPQARKKPNSETISHLAKSKSRWTLEENIAILAKRFPYDPTLKHMLTRERSLTPHIRNAAEYDVFSRDEETLRKMRLRSMSSGPPQRVDRKRKEELMRVQADKVKILETQAGQSEAAYRTEERKMFEQVKDMAKTYLEKREHGRPSVTLFLGVSYQQLRTSFPQAIKRNFPFENYGAALNKTTKKPTCN